MMVAAEWIPEATETFYLPVYREMNLIGKAFIIKTMSQNTLSTKQRTSLGKKWTVVDWPSQSTNCNPIEQHFNSCRGDWREKSSETNNKWKKLLYKPDKKKWQKKNASVWWCHRVSSLMQLLKSKDMQPNINCYLL